MFVRFVNVRKTKEHFKRVFLGKTQERRKPNFVIGESLNGNQYVFVAFTSGDKAARTSPGDESSDTENLVTKGNALCLSLSINRE